MRPARGGFAGELGLVSLFDLGQLLMLNRATGVLAAEDDGGRGYLYFRDGQIVNAVDDTRLEGEVAAYRIFTWKRGHFEFKPEAVTTEALIHESTEGLMLEAARRMDEAALEAGGTSDEARRLAGRSDAMLALREVFSAVARETRTQVPAARGGAAGGIDSLGGPGDRLVLRPGRPARTRLGGAWREARDASLSDAEYAEVRARLLGPDAGPDGARRTVIALPGGRTVRVERIAERDGEALWVRPAALAPTSAARLLASPDEMAALHGLDRGLALVGGDDADAAERVLHALAAERLARWPELVLLASPAGTYRHDEGAGVLVEVEPDALAESIRTLAPETLAIGVPVVPAGSLASLAGVRRIYALAPAGSGESALAAWLDGLDPADHVRAAAWAATMPAMWIEARAAEGASETLPIAVRALGAGAEAGGERGSRGVSPARRAA
jgi:hypothetical protein